MFVGSAPFAKAPTSAKRDDRHKRARRDSSSKRDNRTKHKRQRDINTRGIRREFEKSSTTRTDSAVKTRQRSRLGSISAITRRARGRPPCQRRPIACSACMALFVATLPVTGPVPHVESRQPLIITSIIFPSRTIIRDSFEPACLTLEKV